MRLLRLEEIEARNDTHHYFWNIFLHFFHLPKGIFYKSPPQKSIFVST